ALLVGLFDDFAVGGSDGFGAGGRRLHLPATTRIHERCRRYLRSGEVAPHLRKGGLRFRRGCPRRSVAEGGVVGHLCGGTRLSRRWSGGVDRRDRAMSITEVAEAGLCGVGCPCITALVGEVVIGDLLAADDEDFLLSRAALEKTLVDQSVVTAGLGRVGSCHPDR